MKGLKRTVGKIFFLGFWIMGLGGEVRSEEMIQLKKSDLSIKLEIENAIQKGVAWLKKNQQPDGSWSSPEHPAVTALALRGIMGSPSEKNASQKSPEVKKGFDFILGCVKPDGGIYQKGLENYNTSLSLMALLQSGKKDYEPVILKARNFICSQQFKRTDGFDGGIGYGSKPDHPDLSNTIMALEALSYSKVLKEDGKAENLKDHDINWKAAIAFVQRCQHLPEYNKQKWVSDDSQNKGGFVYDPENSKAGEMDRPDGRKTLRAYGSMSYAGMLSYIYADMDRKDPRVTAVFEWLQKNYTLDENPGMGQEGLYYYFHTMAKALTLYQADKIKISDGRQIDWRQDLSKRLFNLQKADGSWANENGRWWEKDPALVTSYSIIALEYIHNKI